MPDEKGNLWPGDEGYKGGQTETTVYIDGKVKSARVVKDANGNVVYVGITDKILGIF